MKVAYIAANFGTSFATETHIAREFEGLGHEVVRIHEQSPLGKIEEHARGADLVVYTKCRGLSTGAWTMWQRLEEQGTPSLAIHLDLWVGLLRETEVGVDPMWGTTWVATADGDPHSAEVFASHGIDHHWLPPAVVSDEAIPGTFRPELAADVVFVGHARYPHAAVWPWRREMLTFLRRRYGDRFVVYDHGSGMRDLRLNDLYASAKVVVGDSLALPGHRNYFSDRYFETVGRGGFLIGPQVPGIEEFLTDYQHLRLYDIGDTEQLGRMIDFYISAPEKGREMARAGRAWVREHHTYRNRIFTMLKELGLA